MNTTKQRKTRRGQATTGAKRSAGTSGKKAKATGTGKRSFTKRRGGTANTSAVKTVRLKKRVAGDSGRKATTTGTGKRSLTKRRGGTANTSAEKTVRLKKRVTGATNSKATNQGARTVQLKMRLKGFIEADTASQFEGYLEPGRYTVKELRMAGEAKYARVVAPGLGANDTWICYQWHDQTYGVLEEQEEPSRTPRQGFEEVELSVPESTLLDLLSQFTDFVYDLDEARYPYQLRGCSVPMAPPKSNNCCTFVEALVVGAWQAEYRAGEFEWSSHRHRQMMIMSTDDYFSPVTACAESGIAQAVADPDEPPLPWTVVQGWRHQWRSGHSLIIVDHHDQTDRLLTLESNSAYGLNGVGFRSIGNLRDFPAPPPRWWERSSLWTWEQFKSTYRYRQQAALKVRNRSWSGLA